MQRILAVGLLVFHTMLAAIIIADPATLGIPPIAMAWLAIVSVGTATLLNLLPRIRMGDNGRRRPEPHG